MEAVDRFYSSRAWRKCRASFIAMRAGLCERCAERGLLVIGTEVHHKKRLRPWNLNDPSVTLSFSNLVLLCDECHQREHGKMEERADVDGHVEL